MTPRLLLQQAHSQALLTLLLFVGIEFHVLFTPLSGFFSPFPHGTSSLSVSQEYFALSDGPDRFTQGYTCPALLRILLS